jgi:hypothetical protein
MKPKPSLSVLLILGSALLFVLACQGASQAAPVPTSAPATAEAPASAPTEALPPTSAAKLDISPAVLSLEDLPAGFEKLSLEELGASMADFSTDDFQPEHAFVFINTQNFQMIFGFNFLLNETLDRLSFDLGVSQPDVILPAFVEGMGTENVRDQKSLEDIEDIGEKQIGMTTVAALEDTSMQVGVLMFRRDIIGAMVMSMSLEGQTPNISIHDLGRKLDQRILGTLQTFE